MYRSRPASCPKANSLLYRRWREREIGRTRWPLSGVCTGWRQCVSPPCSKATNVLQDEGDCSVVRDDDIIPIPIPAM